VQPDGAPLDEGPGDCLAEGGQHDQPDPVHSGQVVPQSGLRINGRQLAVDQNAVREVEATTRGTGVCPQSWGDQLGDGGVHHRLDVQVLTRSGGTSLTGEVQVEGVADTRGQAEQGAQGCGVNTRNLLRAGGLATARED